MTTLISKNIGGLSIQRIERSKNKISFLRDIKENESVTIQLHPTLFIDLVYNIFAVNIKVLFYNDAKDTAISHPMSTVVCFNYSDFHTVFSLTEENVQINKMNVILKMLDISIGTTRGILYEQTQGTTLNNFSLPIIVLEDFIKKLKINVVKKKEEA